MVGSCEMTLSHPGCSAATLQPEQLVWQMRWDLFYHFQDSLNALKVGTSDILLNNSQEVGILLIVLSLWCLSLFHLAGHNCCPWVGCPTGAGEGGRNWRFYSWPVNPGRALKETQLWALRVVPGVCKCYQLRLPVCDASRCGHLKITVLV